MFSLRGLLEWLRDGPGDASGGESAGSRELSDRDIAGEISGVVLTLEEEARAKEEEHRRQVERDREEAPRRYKDRVDRVLASLPSMIERSLRTGKFDWGGRVIVERVPRSDFRKIQCGYAEPRPGSYSEYLCGRLREIGTFPHCTIEPAAFGQGPSLVVIEKPTSRIVNKGSAAVPNCG